MTLHAWLASCCLLSLPSAGLRYLTIYFYYLFRKHAALGGRTLGDPLASHLQC